MGLECGISKYMGKQVDNPVDQFIEIAPDSPTQQGIVPQMKNGKPTIATIEYELLSTKPYACMRASPLTRQYGWGAHYDERGGIAIYPAEGKEYQRFVKDKNIKKFSAMRSKRA